MGYKSGYKRGYCEGYEKAINDFMNEIIMAAEPARPVGWTATVWIITSQRTKIIAETLKERFKTIAETITKRGSIT